MNFREAKKEDIESILEVISHAKEYMKRNNSTQWNENYPNKETIINDIEKNIGYVLIVENLIRGYIVVDFSDDEIYKNIKGKWKTFGNYASIHRCAIHKELRGQGYGSELFKFAEKLALSKNIRSVRIDTAPENETMKHLFNKNGYEYCGIVFIDGEKIAYEKLLTSNLEYK
ncbi:GNAT family N-acetyltransferase [Fusobacterium mortiferum]|jgi:ribosomal protein S18 acetylase RimI-like enzyme|uniref:GNAT family N-acetyltransferase n=1 Tax=Fusobacterium mortiferum TaxID=850 RepID=UPI001F2424FF|nr:GNAT family N-acetyltransferase [Fusobacterium mortiferum]MCF2698409.1 GNAT family N-acetyltransferase [Fusobacterium mortiferum]